MWPDTAQAPGQRTKTSRQVWRTPLLLTGAPRVAWAGLTPLQGAVPLASLLKREGHRVRVSHSAVAVTPQVGVNVRTEKVALDVTGVTSSTRENRRLA